MFICETYNEYDLCVIDYESNYRTNAKENLLVATLRWKVAQKISTQTSFFAPLIL